MTLRLDQAIRDTGRRRRHRRAGTVFWTVVVLVPVLACAVTVAWVHALRTTPPPSDNPLLDRYLSAIARERDRDWYGPRVPDRTFAAWEDEFGDDPEYWMLRSFESRDLLPAADASARDGLFFYYLQEAHRRGCTDAPLLKSLILLSDGRWCRELEDLTGEQQPFDRSGPETYHRDWLRYCGILRAMITEAHGDELDTLLAELQAKAPDCSATWYLSAKFAAQSGDPATAMELVRRGNRAPVNSTLNANHYKAFQEMLETKDPWFADPVIAAGVINDYYASQDYYSCMGLTGAVRSLAWEATSRNDPAALDELHIMACRLGAARAQTVLDTYNDYRLADRIRSTYSSCQDVKAMTREELQVYLDLSNRLDHIKALNRQGRQFVPTVTPPSSLWLDSYYVYGGTRMQIDSLTSQATVVNNLATTQDQLRQAYLDLAGFSYAELPWDKPRESPANP